MRPARLASALLPDRSDHARRGCRAACRANVARGASQVQAVAVATEGATYAVFADKQRGGIKPGLAADLTIYDRDPFRDDHARVIGTYIRGVSGDDGAGKAR